MDVNNIPVIILCGGQGTRLKEETEYRPKPMVDVGGKPILWHIMKHYDHHGFNKFVLALGYKGNYIKDFFLSQETYISNFTLHTKTGQKDIHNRYHEDDFEITFVDTGQHTLTGGRVVKLKDYVDSDLFMVTYGDGLSNVDISKLVDFHVKSGKIGTITGVNPTSRFGLVIADENNVVTGFNQKPKLQDFINGGFMIFDKRFFDYLGEEDMIEYGFVRLVEDGELALFPHNDFWFAVDTMRDLEEANRLWNEEGGPWAEWRTDVSKKKIDSSIDREPRAVKETSDEEFLRKVYEK